jgi:hypothetical protein
MPRARKKWLQIAKKVDLTSCENIGRLHFIVIISRKPSRLKFFENAVPMQ